VDENCPCHLWLILPPARFRLTFGAIIRHGGVAIMMSGFVRCLAAAAVLFIVSFITSISQSAVASAKANDAATAKALLSDPNVCWRHSFLRKDTRRWDDVGSIPGYVVETYFRQVPPSIQVTSAGTYFYSRSSGDRFLRVPCPPRERPPTGATYQDLIGFSSWFTGLQIVKTTGTVRSAEQIPGTEGARNSFTDTNDPVGFGGQLGYKFTVPQTIVAVAPFVSLDYLNTPVNHTFPNGSFLGTTAKWDGTVGVKAGPQLGTVWLYGLAGLSVLNETLKVNFIPTSSSKNATVAGPTVGAGLAWSPNVLQGFGLPVSLFVEYQHTFWQAAQFNMPSASPAFNYTFERQDDIVKAGFTVAFGR
jgi:hypothetical protein